ncbi:MAG: hypothetical protein ACFFG0_41310 [Candidatus Thorarchaeota archaeon]
MKANTKYILFFLGFLVLLTVSVPSLHINKAQDEAIDIYHLGNSQVSWNVSEYINFIGPPIDISNPHHLEVFRIVIDDKDPNYNWSKIAVEKEWCTDSGVKWDPYISEGLYIDAKSDGGGIYIKSTNKHFIFRNCRVNKSGIKGHDAGVLFRWAENGVIKDNIFTSTRIGIWVQFACWNILVSGNYIIGNTSMLPRAFNVDNNCYNVTYSKNVVFNCHSGMYASRTVLKLKILNNYVANFVYKEWEDAPIYLSEVSGAQINYNTLNGVYAKLGVFTEVIGGGNNTIINNTLVSPYAVDIPDIPILSDGPKLHSSDRCGIGLQECYNNLVAHNLVIKRDSDTAIAGYDVLLTVSLVGIVGTILVIKLRIRKLT